MTRALRHEETLADLVSLGAQGLGASEEVVQVQWSASDAKIDGCVQRSG